MMNGLKVMRLCVISAFLMVSMKVGAKGPAENAEPAGLDCVVADEVCLSQDKSPQLYQTALNPCEGIENCTVVEPAPERVYPSCSVSEPPCTAE